MEEHNTEPTINTEDTLAAPEIRQRHSSSYSYVPPKKDKLKAAAAKKQASSESAAESKSAAFNEKESCFECNICLDTACNPVVTQCGHLFCW